MPSAMFLFVAYSRNFESTSSKSFVLESSLMEFLRGDTVTFKNPFSINMERRSTTCSPSSTTFTQPFGKGVTLDTRAITPTE